MRAQDEHVFCYILEVLSDEPSKFTHVEGMEAFSVSCRCYLVAVFMPPLAFLVCYLLGCENLTTNEVEHIL